MRSPCTRVILSIKLRLLFTCAAADFVPELGEGSITTSLYIRVRTIGVTI